MKPKSKIVSLASIATAVLASRGAASAPRPTHVACVGDSITAGVGASTSNTTYPGVLQTLFGSSVQVRNFGHSGATMMSVADVPYQQQSEYTSATTFVSNAGSSAVVDVIIMLGTNDSKPWNWPTGGTRATQFKQDCSAMVDHFAQLATHPYVFLALPPRVYTNTYQIDGTVLHDQIIPIIKQCASDKGIPVIDIDTPTAGHSEYFGDGVHPNDAGYKVVAQAMYKGLLAASGGAGGSGGMGSGGASSGSTGGSRTGGASSTGGVSPTGGASLTGGTRATGGGLGTGGTSAAGGATTTGGSRAAGGSLSTGGTTTLAVTTGGAAATGGGNAVGGSSATTGGAIASVGGSAIGGQTVGFGGAKATGGVVTTGGRAGATTTTPNTSPVVTNTGATSDSGGCGCRVAKGGNGSNSLALLGSLGLLLVRLRRKRTSPVKQFY